jgi:hypothetical protein
MAKFVLSGSYMTELYYCLFLVKNLPKQNLGPKAKLQLHATCHTIHKSSNTTERPDVKSCLAQVSRRMPENQALTDGQSAKLHGGGHSRCWPLSNVNAANAKQGRELEHAKVFCIHIVHYQSQMIEKYMHWRIAPSI